MIGLGHISADRKLELLEMPYMLLSQQQLKLFDAFRRFWISLFFGKFDAIKIGIVHRGTWMFLLLGLSLGEIE